MTEGSNQYAPSRGLPALREAVAAHYLRHQGIDVTADHVCVTSGATEALGAAILATVEPGDEVIIFTPAYDSYAPMIRRAGGTPVEVALEPPGWRIERGALEAAVGAEDPRDPVQQPAQSRGPPVRCRGARSGRSGRARRTT